jgi:hypothetical protein
VRLSVTAALLAVPGEALGANTVRTFSVTGRLVAPAGHPSTLSLQCPADAVALNGAVSRKGAGAVVRRSTPGHGSGDWSFRLAASGSGSRAVSAVLRCVRLQLPAGLSGARLDVRTRLQSSIDIAPGATKTTRVGCGSAWTATGYALAAGRRADVRLAEVLPDAHGWTFTLENTGSATAHAGVSARCISSRATAHRSGGGSAELAFGVSRQARLDTVGPGAARTFTHRCGGGGFSLATGSIVNPLDPIELALSSPAGPGAGRWTFANASTGDPVRSYLVCLSRGSRFH